MVNGSVRNSPIYLSGEGGGHIKNGQLFKIDLFQKLGILCNMNLLFPQPLFFAHQKI